MLKMFRILSFDIRISLGFESWNLASEIHPTGLLRFARNDIVGGGEDRPWPFFCYAKIKTLKHVSYGPGHIDVYRRRMLLGLVRS